ncbi:hypothetical protein HOLleu_39965 [Holothuria leucospilota]|uniref:Uncharacterized protein n=1 Tax=Holothuria leucospilota TaxID=206669 RepID=A0A9Q0YKG9_HOLLE|nr:hypothetical protein HOLleu_39965 [Holothuria leucospilota]
MSCLANERKRNATEGADQRKDQRRGPYKKWAGEESAEVGSLTSLLCQDFLVEYEDVLDEILDELRTAAQQQQHDELADELSDPLHVVGEEVLSTENEDIPESSGEENGDGDDPPLYPGSKRHLGVIILLLCCFMIRFRLSQETMHHLLCLIQLLLPGNNCLTTSLHGI